MSRAIPYVLLVAAFVVVTSCGRRKRPPKTAQRPANAREIRRPERRVDRAIKKDKVRKKEKAATLVAELVESGLPPQREAALVRRVLLDKRLAKTVRRLLRPQTLERLRVTYGIKGAVPDDPGTMTLEPKATPAAPTPTKAGAAVEVSLQVPAVELKALGIKRIAVPTIAGSGIDDTMLQVLSDVALSEAGRIGGLSVIGASDIEALLNFEQQKDLVGCDDIGCIAQIGGALGVDALLSCKIGQLGETYVITATVIDINGSRPLARGDVRYQAAPDELIDIVAELVQQSLQPIISTAQP